MPYIIISSIFAAIFVVLMMVVYGNKLSIPVTAEFKQLVNISIAAGKFILIHPTV